MKRPVVAKRVRAVLALLVGVGVLSACAGENLFSLAASVGQTGPDVEITSPTSGATATIGDSVLVTATVSASNGAASVVYSGTYGAEGDAAYVQETSDLNGLVNLSLSNRLRAVPSQRAGTAIVVVSVTDQAGETGADTVTVTISAGVTN